MDKSLHFEKFSLEHHNFIRELKKELNCYENDADVVRALRAVLHTLRDRVTLQHAFHLLANLPAFLKLYFVEGWKYHEKPIKYHSPEEFCEAVNAELFHLGDRDKKRIVSTATISNIILVSLKKYWSDAEVEKLFTELPPELFILFENNKPKL